MHARINSRFWASGMSSQLDLVARPRDSFAVQTAVGDTTGSKPVDVLEVLRFDPSATFVVYGEGIPEDLRVAGLQSKRLPLSRWAEVVSRLGGRQ